MKSFHEAYRGLLQDIMQRGHEEVNARTNTKIKALFGATSFSVHLGAGLPVAGNRRYWPHVAGAELAWQLMGTKKPDFILKHAPKLWSKFVEQGELKAAYGWRWMEAFGRDQLSQAVQAIQDDPTNRQLWVQAWDPGADGLGNKAQPKNIPCPIGFTINVVKEQVHMSVFVRSSDVFVGLPYDVMCYALLLDSIAATIGRAPGVLHFTLAHAHIYEPHFNAVRECLSLKPDPEANYKVRDSYKDRGSWTSPKIQLPAWSLEMVRSMPEEYIAHLKLLTKRAGDMPEWDPQPILVE